MTSQHRIPFPGAAEDGPPPAEDEIQRWVTAARQGSRSAAAALYRLHVRRIYRTVRPLCRSDAEAEDVVQETFARALSALGRYRRRRGTRFVSWLSTIALNEARRMWRRRAQPRPPEDLEHRSGGSQPDPQARLLEEEEQERRRRALLSAMDELRPRDRRILLLRYAAGLTAREVGGILHLRSSHVRKICQRSRNVLLERLTRELAEAVPCSESDPRSEEGA